MTVFGRNELFILDKNHQLVRETDEAAWSRWMYGDPSNRQVAEDHIDILNSGKKVRVSTIFLGYDHRDFHDQKPKFFETKVFGGANHGDGFRWTTWEDAIEGHQFVMEDLKNRDWSDQVGDIMLPDEEEHDAAMWKKLLGNDNYPLDTD